MDNSSLFACAASCSDKVPDSKAARSSSILVTLSCKELWLSSHAFPDSLADDTAS